MLLHTVCFSLIVATVWPNIIELNGSFLEIFQEGAWLVNFYAPWCGHCRRLAPVYEELGSTLPAVVPSVKVARIDASTFVSVGKQFNVKGFPTIMYIEGHKRFTYDGERSMRGILSFVRRVHGPAVKTFQTQGELQGNISLFDGDPHFVFIDRPDSYLKTVFYEVAERLRLLSWFSAVSPTLLPSLLPSGSLESDVVVFKDGKSHFYPDAQDTSRLPAWILRERLSSFPFFSSFDIWDFGETELAGSAALLQMNAAEGLRRCRLLALYLLHPSSTSDAQSTRFLEVGRSLAMKRLNSLVEIYQFGWTDSIGLLTELAMVHIGTPSLIVLDPVNHFVYLHSNSTSSDGVFSSDPDVATDFLLSVAEGRAMAYGGNGFIARLRRFCRGFFYDLLSVAAQHPMFTLVTCSMPVMFLSGVFYICCCLDNRYDEDGDMAYNLGEGTTDASGEPQPQMISSSCSGRPSTETGPPDSKDVTEATKHMVYEQWKKTQ